CREARAFREHPLPARRYLECFSRRIIRYRCELGGHRARRRCPEVRAATSRALPAGWIDRGHDCKRGEPHVLASSHFEARRLLLSVRPPVRPASLESLYAQLPPGAVDFPELTAPPAFHSQRPSCRDRYSGILDALGLRLALRRRGNHGSWENLESNVPADRRVSKSRSLVAGSLVATRDRLARTTGRRRRRGHGAGDDRRVPLPAPPLARARFHRRLR